MIQILIKRVYEPASLQDGFRVLVDRMWPRGVRKEELKFDLWAKDITPSDGLRRWYHADVEGRWDGFRARYAEELESSQDAEAFVRRIAGMECVTLLYASHDVQHNHALVLQEFLRGRLGE